MEVVGQPGSVGAESNWRPQYAIGTGPTGGQGRRHCRHPELYLGSSHPGVEQLGCLHVQPAAPTVLPDAVGAAWDERIERFQRIQRIAPGRRGAWCPTAY